MNYRYRFTLDGDYGSHSITEPIGWADIELNLDRDMTYHSLIENITIPLTFYAGANGEDGGYDYLKTALADGDPDVKVSIEIEISTDDGATYENLFTGLLAVGDHRHLEFYKKIEIPVMRDDLWSRFIARKSQDVDLKSTEDLYGNTVVAVPDHELTLPPQEVRQVYEGELDAIVEYNLGALDYGVIDMDVDVQNEVKTKFNYPRIQSDGRPFELFALEYAGDYQIDIIATVQDVNETDQVPDTNLYVQINDETPVAASVTQQGVNGVNGSTKFTYSDSHTLQAGDHIRIYFKEEVGTPVDFNLIPNIGGDITSIRIQADTVYPETTVGGIFFYDMLSGITERITGQPSPIVSEYFGGSDTVDPYDEPGCGYDFKIFRGLQVRGYSYTDKPFTTSFDQIFSGLDGIFNLGLGYEEDESSPDGNVIRIEPKSYFYDDTGFMEALSDVAEIEMSFDLELMFNKISIGYNKWEAEAESGLDDPQTKQQYGTPLRTEGKEKDIISSFIAASLALEQTRRVEGLKQGQDWRLDEDIFIVQTDPANSDVPRLLTAPYAVTNVLNWETRYNLQLTPHDNLLRWKNILSIGVHAHPTGFFTYRSGEGNQKMIFDGTGATQPDCDLTDYLAQNANEVIGSDFLFKPVLYRFSHTMTYAQYKSIRNNRRSGITISYVGNDGHSYTATLFIKKLAYMINEGTVQIEAWVKTVTDLGDASGGSVFSEEFSEEFA